MPEILDEARLIFAEEFRRFTRGKGYKLLTLAVPGILLVLMVAIPAIRAISEDEEDPKPIGMVVLYDNLAFAPNVVPGFLALNDRQDGIDALKDKRVKEVFVVPKEYLATGRVEWLHAAGGTFSGFDPGPSDASSAAVMAYLRTGLAGEDVAPRLLVRAVAGTAFESVRIGKDGRPVKGDIDAEIGTFIVSFGSTILLMFSIMIGASGLAQAIAEEKENRMIEVLLTSAKPLSVMAGKVLAIGTAQLIMVTVWAGSLVFMVPRIADTIPNASDIPVKPEVLVWVLAFFLAGYFVSSVIMAGVGAMTTKTQEANQLAFLVIVPLVAPFYAMMSILGNPDGSLARVLSFIPFTAPVAMMIRLAVGGSSTLENLASLMVVVVTGAILLLASTRIFRAGLLMYGQRMSFRHMISALREAG